MLTMFSSTAPLNKIDDSMKVLLTIRAKPLPPHIKIVGSYTWIDGEAKTIQIIEIEKGHEDEAFKALNNILLQYRNIEGLKMKIQPISTLEEAAAVQGITLHKR